MVFDWASSDGYHSRYCLSTENDAPYTGQVRMTYDPTDLGWSEHIRGSTAMCLVDDGNGVCIHVNDENDENDEKYSFDYSQLCELYMLLTYYFFHSGLSDENAVLSKFLPVK